MSRPVAAAACAVAAAILLLFPAPAGAHSFEAAELSSPAAGAAPYDAPPALGGRFVHTETGIDRVELSVIRDGGPGGDGCTTPSLSPVPGGGEEEVTFSVPLPALPCNGEYLVTARAVAGDPTALHSGRPEASASGAFALAAPPARARNLEVDHDEEARTVALSWRENTEVDLLGYLVERAVDDGPFEVLADTTSTGYLDADLLEEGGLHVYRVRAVRRGPNAQVEAVAGDPSPDREVAVEPVPEPTTTTSAAPPPPTTPPDRGKVDLSGFGNLEAAASKPVRRSPPVTIDTGFSETLPFAAPPPPEPEPEPAPTTTPPPGRGAAVITYVETSEKDLRKVMVPAAGAMALLVGSLHIRYLLRQAALPEA